MADRKTESKASMMPISQQDDDVVVVATTAEPEGTMQTFSMETIKGELQPPAYRDWPFAALFFVQVAAIAGTALALGPAAIRGSSGESDSGVGSDDALQNDDTFSKNHNNVLWSKADTALFLVGSFLAASLITMSAFRIMIHHPLTVIQVSFFAAPVTFGVVALLVLAASAPSEDKPQGDVHDSIVGMFWMMAAVFSLISLCFYFCYKRFMPFAAINLKAALTAVRANKGLFGLSVGALFLIYAWSLLWILAMAGVVYHDQQKPQVPCSQVGDGEYHQDGEMCDQQPSAFAMVMLLLCLYWTQQVIQNTLHTTTAGTVSSWWIQPAQDEILSQGGGGGICCGQDVSDALYRSCTYSLGSICFGSLLTAILQTLEQMARHTRNRRDVVSMILQCLIICLRAWLEYFNSWAFCYVGIYGYDYLSAGRKVIELFKQRGWTTLITDRLVFRVLLMANLGISAVTGLVCVLMMCFLGFHRFPNSDVWAVALLIAFWVGFVVALIISNTVLFVVESAVRTIMVCFAEQPGESGQTDLAQELQETYARTYPGVFVFRNNNTEMDESSRMVV